MTHAEVNIEALQALIKERDELIIEQNSLLQYRVKQLETKVDIFRNAYRDITSIINQTVTTGFPFYMCIEEIKTIIRRLSNV